MKADQLKQIEFIKSLLRKGWERAKILQQFTKTYKTGVKTFDNRLKIAREAIKAEVKAINKKSSRIVAKESKAQALQTLSVAERIDILTKIAKGEIKIRNDKYFYDSKFGTVVSQQVDELPDHVARIKAVAEINKMAGDYAPTKTDVTVNELPKIIMPGE